MESQPDMPASSTDSEYSDSEEEAWEDKVQKCREYIHVEGQPDIHHSKYFEVGSDSENIKKTIRERIKEKLGDHNICEMLKLCVNQEILDIDKRIHVVKNFPKETWPRHMLIEFDHRFNDKDSYLEYLQEGLKVAIEKKESRLQDAKLREYMNESLDNVTEEIMRKIDGVVRIQRPAIEGQRNHGNGTGILVRMDFLSRNSSNEFAILTNTHLIKNDSEVKGSTIDFFYNVAAGKARSKPPGVETRMVTEVITWSPQVPKGEEATHEMMDFSLLKFDPGSDSDDFIGKLHDSAFYLNEFLQNATAARPYLNYFEPLLVVAISHPHGSNKRISFGSIKHEEVQKLCTNDSVSYSIQYDVATCKGSSGSPVIAIQMDHTGRLKACFQFLHFKKKKGIVVKELYEKFNNDTDFAQNYFFFKTATMLRDITFVEKRFPLWWDEGDRERYHYEIHRFHIIL